MRHTYLKKLLKTAVIIATLVVALTAVSCKKEKNSVERFYGDISYDAPMLVMSMEEVEDEEEPGIVYREIEDLDAVLNNSPVPVMIYFYSSTATDVAGVTAGVEDIAQKLDGRVIVLSVDIMRLRDVASRFKVQYVPDFVLVQGNNVKSSFNAIDYDYWTTTDVYNWLINEGV